MNRFIVVPPSVGLSFRTAPCAGCVIRTAAGCNAFVKRQRARTRNGTTDDTAVVPSSPRAIATTLTRSFLWNLAGSRNARYGGDVSTARRRHADPRRTANATLTGALPATVAEAAQRLVSSSPLM